MTTREGNPKLIKEELAIDIETTIDDLLTEKKESSSPDRYKHRIWNIPDKRIQQVIEDCLHIEFYKGYRYANLPFEDKGKVVIGHCQAWQNERLYRNGFRFIQLRRIPQNTPLGSALTYTLTLPDDSIQQKIEFYEEVPYIDHLAGYSQAKVSQTASKLDLLAFNKLITWLTEATP